MIVAHRLALASVVSTLVLIGVGVFVRATGSGLGCPDWPTCHGGLLPPADRTSVIEVSHRFVAAGVGFLVIALAVAGWRSFRARPAISYVAIAIVPMVGIQGFLGALTVWWELPPAIVATHLLTAFVVVSALIFVLIEIDIQVRGQASDSTERAATAGVWAVLTILMLGAVAWLGGYMTESGASTACPSWPGCHGWSFVADDRHELIHMLHRYLVAALTPIQLGLAVVILRAPRPVPWSWWLSGSLVALLVAQIAVGAFNVWYQFPDVLAISHTVLASLIWSVATAIAVLALRPIVVEFWQGAPSLASRPG